PCGLSALRGIDVTAAAGGGSVGPTFGPLRPKPVRSSPTPAGAGDGPHRVQASETLGSVGLRGNRPRLRVAGCGGVGRRSTKPQVRPGSGRCQYDLTADDLLRPRWQGRAADLFSGRSFVCRE